MVLLFIYSTKLAAKFGTISPSVVNFHKMITCSWTKFEAIVNMCIFHVHFCWTVFFKNILPISLLEWLLHAWLFEFLHHYRSIWRLWCITENGPCRLVGNEVDSNPVDRGPKPHPCRSFWNHRSCCRLYPFHYITSTVVLEQFFLRCLVFVDAMQSWRRQTKQEHHSSQNMKEKNFGGLFKFIANCCFMGHNFSIGSMKLLLFRCEETNSFRDAWFCHTISNIPHIN